MPPMMGGGNGHLHDGGAVTDAPLDHKTTLNIDIYPFTLVFF